MLGTNTLLLGFAALIVIIPVLKGLIRSDHLG